MVDRNKPHPRLPPAPIPNQQSAASCSKKQKTKNGGLMERKGRDFMMRLLTILFMLISKSLQQQQIPPKEQEINDESVRELANRWQWDHNHHDTVRPLNAFYNSSIFVSGESTYFVSRRLLIVQDSAPGPEEEVLEATSRVNRAYAKRWGYDYLKFTGVAMGTSPWQATFNKPFILSNLMEGSIEGMQVVMKGSPVYDAVMFLDSSAIIVELDFNILHLLGKDKLLASGWIGPAKSINAMYSDVMIWNLDHPKAKNISA